MLDVRPDSLLFVFEFSAWARSGRLSLLLGRLGDFRHSGSSLTLLRRWSAQRIRTRLRAGNFLEYKCDKHWQSVLSNALLTSISDAFFFVAVFSGDGTILRKASTVTLSSTTALISSNVSS